MVLAFLPVGGERTGRPGGGHSQWGTLRTVTLGSGLVFPKDRLRAGQSPRAGGPRQGLHCHSGILATWSRDTRAGRFPLDTCELLASTAGCPPLMTLTRSRQLRPQLPDPCLHRHPARHQL